MVSADLSGINGVWRPCLATMIIRTECKVDNVTVSYTVAYSPIDHVQVGKYAHELYIAIIYLFNHSS